jgi:hypothetical protein
LGAIAGALTGLLFVAISIKSDLLTASRNLSSRAAQALCLFMTAVLIALLVAVPQPSVALGVEPLLLAVGVTLLLHAGGGLYWLLAVAVAGLLGGVVSAWLFLVKITA